LPDLAGRRVLVTGGSKGIGRAVGEELAGAGAAVLVVARTREDVDATVAALPGDGHAGLALDVADEAAWDAASSSGALDGVDGVVTAAGLLTPIGPLGRYDVSEFRRTLDVNVVGTLLAIHHCAGGLRSAVTFSGGGATAPLPRYDAYAASKAAVVRLTENLAAEGLRVNAVAPGFVATDIHAATFEAGEDLVGSDYFDRTQRQVAEGGVPASASAELVAFLLSDDAQGISGKLISAQWDPWREPEFRRRLADEPDLATLRRIDDQFFVAKKS
jgi:3-oxoacyl-[acyl-carrier protein] reductase